MAEELQETPPRSHPISVELFSRTSSKTTRLINNIKDENKLDGRSRWYDFELKQPIYILDISVETSGYSSWNMIEFDVHHVDGTRHEQKVKISPDGTKVQIGKLANKFSFKPDAKWLSETQVSKVVVTGLSLDEFHSYEWALKDFDKREASIKELEADLESKNATKKELESTASTLSTDIGKAKAQLETLETNVESTKKTLLDTRATLKDVESELSDKRSTRRNLTSEIAEAEDKLESVTREVRLFPSEIAGFVKEGNRSTILFILFSIPFTLNNPLCDFRTLF